MNINHNIPALRTLNQLSRVNRESSKTMERLSSGLRINRSADDAAGLAIANKMDAQVRGLKQANRNTMDSISMVQTAEGALNETHAILQRMRELAVQASNGTYSENDLKRVQEEINELTSEINRIGNDTEFNKKKLLKGKEQKTGLADLTPPIDIADGGNTSIDFNNKDVEKLLGKGMNIDGEDVFFYDSSKGQKYEGTGIGIDLNGVTTAAGVVTQVVSEVGTKIDGVTVANLGNGVLQITNTTGEEIQVKDGAVAPMNVTLQVGANEDQTMEVEMKDMRAEALGLAGKAGDAGFTAENTVTNTTGGKYEQAAVSVSSIQDAEKAITIFNDAIEKVSEQRGKFGAFQNRLEHTSNNLATSEENLTASMSRIQDADMAKEMTLYTQQNIISQAANSMLAQANQRPQQVLQLLQR